MDIPHANIVYEFEQRVEIMERESERTKPKEEVYVRHGVILVSTGIKNSHWKREIREYLIAPDVISKFRKEVKVDRAKLQDLHLKAVAAQRIPFGLDLGIEIESDIPNHDVAFPGPERVPIGQDLLYLPTMLPVAPEKRAEPGHEWNGKIHVSGGAGKFTIAYNAKMLEQVAENPRIEVVFQPQSSTQMVNDITLTLTPQGRFVFGISKADGAPLSSEGDIRISIRAKLERDGVPVDVEVLNCHQNFKLIRVPANFDDENFFPAAWQQPNEK